MDRISPYFKTGVPDSYYVIGIFLIIISILLSLFLVKSYKNRYRLISAVSLTVYIMLVLCATTFLRSNAVSSGVKLIPFWSYRQVLQGQIHICLEVIYNVVFFIPVGVLVCCIFPKLSMKNLFKIAVSLSLVIEIMQFLLQRGLCEIDDVIHNSLGCLIGYGIYKGTVKLLNKVEKKQSRIIL